jgi:hypothetical protein
MSSLSLADGRRQTADGSQSIYRLAVDRQRPLLFRPPGGGKGPAAQLRVGGLSNLPTVFSPDCRLRSTILPSAFRFGAQRA